jgi:hypothetical protein
MPESFEIVIFSSQEARPVAEAIKENLRLDFSVTFWSERLSGEANTAVLSLLFKALLCCDLSVFVLVASDLQSRSDIGSAGSSSLPEDLTFEMGATLGRIGPRKTIIVVPDSSELALPKYVRGLGILTYRVDEGRDPDAASRSASTRIRAASLRMDEQAFHSDLPSIGLAYGYFLNFISPLIGALSEAQTTVSDWPAENNFTLTIALPDHILNRQEVDRLLRRAVGADNLIVRFRDGRELSVYILPRDSPAEPLHVIDVPTTLQTSREVIQRIDIFWGGGDRDFCATLEKREIQCFGRTIRSLIHEAHLDSAQVFVVALAVLPDHIQRLLG